MNNIGHKLSGIIIPAVTPFNERQQFDTDMFAENFEKWNSTGVRGYMVLGSNGEFRSLSDEEALDVIRHAAGLKSADKTLIAGVGREGLKNTLDFIDRVQELDVNVDYISVLTPHYFSKLMNDDALYEYFTTIAEHSKIPVLLYCAPSFANGVCISASLVKRLSSHPNIHGIKDTSTNMMGDYMTAAGRQDNFQIIAGSINTLMTCLVLGGSGGVVSAANYLPHPCVRLYELFLKNGLDGAWDYYVKLQGIAKETGAKGGVAGVKACMNLLGYKAGIPRKPVQPLKGTEQMKVLLEEALTL